MARFPAEDTNTIPATPERVFDEAQVQALRYEAGRLMLSILRTDSEGSIDPEDEGLDLKFNDFDADLARATKLNTNWDKVIQGLGALYRERRLEEKIAERSALGLDTAALEARLASVRSLLGIT